MIYVHVSITVTQGERKCRLALNMRKFSEAQIFVYRQNFNPRNNNEIKLVSKHCATWKAACDRVRGVHVFFVSSRRVHWHCDINVSTMKRNRICSKTCLILTSLPYRRFHAKLKAGNFRLITCQEGLQAEYN